MNALYWGWGISAVVLIIAAGWAGRRSKGTYLGFLIDERNQYSLSKFQVTLWTTLVLSLIGGVVIGRIFHGGDALGFKIPDELLIVMGISLGSGAAAAVVKADQDNRAALRAAALGVTAPTPAPLASATFRQMLAVEQGGVAIETVDLTKFQNFWITLILVAAYIALAANSFNKLVSPSDIKALPGFDGTFVTLLGISHAAYLAGKLPSRNP